MRIWNSDQNSGGSRLFLGTNLLFGIIFAVNCMKIKEIGLKGGARPSRPLDPPLQIPKRFLANNCHLDMKKSVEHDCSFGIVSVAFTIGQI